MFSNLPTTYMAYKIPTLFHGTSIGWLHLSGFGKAKFAFGEFPNPHPFIFLCTRPIGAESAACKAYANVHGRHANKPPAAEYCFAGNDYPIDRYVYEISVNPQSRVLDFHADTLDKQNMALVIQAIGHTSKASVLGTCLTSLELRLEPEHWRYRLKDAFPDRNQMVEALGLVGFDLIRNIERDGDGQNYGEVWALPMSRVTCVKPQQPYIYKLA